MSTVFVTGGTGLTGANVCEQLIARGDAVKALVRQPEEAAALAEIGVELVEGDIVEADADRPPRTAANPTHDQLGYDPMSLDDGLGLLIPWLRDLGRL